MYCVGYETSFAGMFVMTMNDNEIYFSLCLRIAGHRLCIVSHTRYDSHVIKYQIEVTQAAGFKYLTFHSRYVGKHT